MNWSILDQRPLIVVLAGPNGAGKTTFFHSHLKYCGLRFVNANLLRLELGLDPYDAAKVADAIRRELVSQGESFIMQTVFSDPVGDKLNFLKEAADKGYHVVLCFIGISGPKISEKRVAMRVSQGGHDVPKDKLKSRFPRTLKNLKHAIKQLPYVLVFDNNDLNQSFLMVAVFKHGILEFRRDPFPIWISSLFH